MTDIADLLSRLRAMSRGEHDDHAIGDEAAEMIEGLLWRPISDAPSTSSKEPVDLYHLVFGRLTDCFWKERYGWAQKTYGDPYGIGHELIERPAAITHYMLRPPAPETEG